MEITTGLIARTPPGWGILVRGLANWAPQRDHSVLDGFVETDWYRAFLPLIIRLTTPGAEVRFFRRMPMAQLHLVPLAALQPELADTGNGGIADVARRRLARVRGGAGAPAPARDARHLRQRLAPGREARPLSLLGRSRRPHEPVRPRAAFPGRGAAAGVAEHQ